MTTPLARAEFALANSRALSALTGRILAAPAINRSPNAWAPTVYNGGGLIVSVPNVETVAGLRDALWDVLDDFNCRSEGPEWLPDPGEPVPPASFVPSTAGSSSVLAGGVKIIPKTADAGQNVGAPDPWPIVEALRARIGPDLVVSVGLNHLMSSAEQFGGNPLAVGHCRVGLDLYGSISWGGHGPVTLVSPSRPSVTGRRPRVVVLDTGIGDHPPVPGRSWGNHGALRRWRPAAVLGPGGRRRSTLDPDDYRSGYAVWSGTSFAAPLLAGEYLRRLLEEGFPPGMRARRALLPLGRRSRVSPTVVTSEAVSA